MATTTRLANDQALTYPDLRAAVRLGPVPTELSAELPALYGSVFATEDWFRIFDDATAEGACVLDDPRHVLLFTIAGDTVEVLNKAFPIPPADAARACRALFRALPRARRIHLEVLFEPRELGLPLRVLSKADDLVIDLPGGLDAYAASLGRRTRKNLRNYENRLRREHGEPVVERHTSPAAAARYFDQFLHWHLERAGRQGIDSGFVLKPRQADQLAQLVGQLGEAQTVTIHGELAAVEFLFFIGPEATVYAGSFAEAFEDVHLGMLSTFWAVQETARRGARRCHLLWTTGYYKSLLGARPVTATRLSVFRSQGARLHSPGEAWRAAQRHRQSLRKAYWDARHAARGAVEALTGKRTGEGRHH